MQALALRIERHDGAHGFDDLVPPALTIGELTTKAASKLRYPATDASTGRPLSFSMLYDGIELPRTTTVGKALKHGAKVHVVHEHVNA